MLKNYLVTALRHLRRNSVYSFINIAGLSTGLSCSLLIFLWATDEFSFNQFHGNYNTLYKVYMNHELSGTLETQPNVPYPLQEAIANASPHVKHVSVTNYGEGNLLTAGEKKINKVGNAVSEDFLKMFSFNVIIGDSTTALTDPFSIVLTRSTATALFGDKDPLGQYVKIDNNHEVKVTGVIADVVAQSTFQFDYLLPFSFYELTQEWVKNSKDSWRNNSFQMYVELDRSESLETVNETIKELIGKHHTTEKMGQVFLHPMSHWRLYSDFENGKVSGGRIESVRQVLIIAGLILIVACINFMNMATAKSEGRAREVGIRKSVGSRRPQLIVQFLGESVLVTLLAFVLSIVLVELLLPSYNLLVSKQLTIDYSSSWFWSTALAIVLITGSIAGSYPAFYLSSFKPVKVLKGKIFAGKGATTPRKVLVTLQFGFSIFLIVGTIAIYRQVSFLKDRQVGYDRENLMLLWTNTEIESSFQTIKDELIKTGVVKGVCKSSSPITRVFSTTDLEWPGKSKDQRVSFTSLATEYDYTETMGIKMLAGRDFSRDFKSDSSAIIINKAALDVMKLEKPIGETVRMWNKNWTIIGVMNNVVMDSPYHPVSPLVMIFSPDWSSTVTVRLEQTNSISASVEKVEGVFKRLNPNYPMWYRFADDEFNAKYSGITLVSRLAGIFATLAVLITCLGLFGLTAFTAERRQKEISIRKVLGANVASLVLLISKDFTKLVVIAAFISSPIAWLFINHYLQRYPYRIDLEWWTLPLTGSAALLLTIIVVGIQAIRSASANPATCLRNE
jgi:putative ABC transport system permease protein